MNALLDWERQQIFRVMNVGNLIKEIFRLCSGGGFLILIEHEKQNTDKVPKLICYQTFWWALVKNRFLFHCVASFIYLRLLTENYSYSKVFTT